MDIDGDLAPFDRVDDTVGDLGGEKIVFAPRKNAVQIDTVKRDGTGDTVQSQRVDRRIDVDCRLYFIGIGPQPLSQQKTDVLPFQFISVYPADDGDTFERFTSGRDITAPLYPKLFTDRQIDRKHLFYDPHTDSFSVAIATSQYRFGSLGRQRYLKKQEISEYQTS